MKNKIKEWIGIGAMVLAFTCNGNLLEAAIYKWQDNQGKWHFTDNLEKIPERYRQRTPYLKGKSSGETSFTPKTVPLQQSDSLEISIARQKFVPVSMKTAAVQAPVITLGDKPDLGIAVVPAFKGKGQKYGAIQLGTGLEKRYYFVLDLVSESKPVLYFDLNQNGNLADDGEPMVNRGTGIFATQIRIPFHQLVGKVEIPGDYHMWFFTNNSLWKTYRVTHYSQTQFAGEVKLGDKTVAALLAEGNNNDADYTNDGIYLDLDGDGKFDRDKEYFPPGHSARIDGRDYSLKIEW